MLGTKQMAALATEAARAHAKIILVGDSARGEAGEVKVFDPLGVTGRDTATWSPCAPPPA